MTLVMPLAHIKICSNPNVVAMSQRFLLILIILALGISSVAWAVLRGNLPPADFTFHNETEIKSMDPATVTGIPEHRILAAIFEGLAKPNPETYLPEPAPPPEEASLLDLTPVLRQSPPWLVSAIIHMVLLIVLGLLFVKSMEDPRLLLDVMYAEDLGEQLIEEDLDQLLSETQMDFHEQLVTPEDLPEDIDPLATPELTEITPNPTVRAGTFEPTAIGLALTGRTVGHKNALLKAYGGDATTEGAVLLGLKWLQRQQQNSGLWSLKGPYTDGSRAENEEAATAMALLAFQGAGNTHRQGPFKREVAKAWKAMLERQSDNGNFYGNGPDHSRFYTEAQCTIGLCELFGMSQDESLRGPAQLAVDYLVKTQANNGGWRYDVGESGDLSVTGWVVMGVG